MSEATVEPVVPAQDPARTDPPAPVEPVKDDTDWVAEARKWEKRAKDNQGAAKEAEKARVAAMSDAERAVAEAEARGHSAATQKYGARLATSEIRAAAATAGADLGGVFDYLDLARFVAEDGEPDEKAIKAFVSGLPKTGTPPPPSFDGGTRTPAPQQEGMSGLIRKAAGRA